MQPSNHAALIFALIFAAISALLVNSHEMWRDELQAWMLARDSESIIDLFANLKYEGHPGLWHLLLFPTSRIFDSPIAMQYLHVLIAASSVFVLFRWGPFSILQKVLLCLGYFLFFEYSLIARNYSLGIMLIFIACALFPKRRSHPFSIAFVLFLLSHTSVLGLIFAFCFIVTILFEKFWIEENKITQERGFFTYFIALLVVLSGLISAIFQLMPPPDSGFATSWTLHVSGHAIERTLKAFVGAYFPMPKLDLTFWNSRLLLSNWPIGIVTLLILVRLIYFLGKVLRTRPSALFLYISATFALLLFFYTKYTGSLRHHGFLFFVLVSALWIYHYCGERTGVRISTIDVARSKKSLDRLLNVVLLVHVMAAAVAVVIDFKYPFSSAKQTAKFIQENSLSEAQIIGHGSPAASAVAGYMKNKKFYYVDAGRYGSFVRWDNLRGNHVTLESLASISRRLAASGDESILVLNDKIEKFGDAEGQFEKIFESQNAVVGDEKFYVYRFTP